MDFLTKRPRRLRKNQVIRDMIAETSLSVSDFIYPIFTVEGENIRQEISSMPDCFQYSVDQLEEEIQQLKNLGIRAVLLFGVPNHKDEIASSAFDQDGVVQRAIRKIKSIDEDMYVITDVCMCAYTSHGHCGIIKDDYVDNDESLKYISKIALSHARAGADMVAPSDMMDGRVAKIRQTLDENVGILAYSSKYASNYYGPFREAAHSAPQKGDRKSYQMDFHNKKEGLREVALDIEEGADMVMVKPALAYLDVINEVKNNFNIPLVAYNVSGEYAMLKNAVKQNIVSEAVIYETLISIKRAGADIIITYFAKYMAEQLNKR